MSFKCYQITHFPSSQYNFFSFCFKPKYSPYHSTILHPQYVPPIQNIWNYSVVLLNFYVFVQKMGGQTCPEL